MRLPKKKIWVLLVEDFLQAWMPFLSPNNRVDALKDVPSMATDVRN